MAHERDALITGIGIVSCLGSSAEAHWTALNAFTPVVETDSFPPFAVHPLAPLELDRQIPRRGDQRQMETWQRMGVFAAGQALDSAGVKGNTELLARMGMIVAAGGGERVFRALLPAFSVQFGGGEFGGPVRDERLSDRHIHCLRVRRNGDPAWGRGHPPG